MGEMADMALAYANITEDLAYEYTSGDMSLEDAYENGFIDESGVESHQMQHIWDNTPIGSLETLNQELELATTQFDLAVSRMGVPTALQSSHHSQETGTYNEVAGAYLNKEAINNLTKEAPTCNICRNQMVKRDGKFGAFYFCKCEGQGTVSDAYWQKVRNCNE